MSSKSNQDQSLRFQQFHQVQRRSFFQNHFDVNRVISNRDNHTSFEFHRDVGDLRAESVKQAEAKYGKIRPGQGIHGSFDGMDRMTMPLANRVQHIKNQTRILGGKTIQNYNPMRGSKQASWQSQTRGSKIAQLLFNVQPGQVQYGYASSIRCFLIVMTIMVGGAFSTICLVANVGVTDIVAHVQRLNDEVERELELSKMQEHRQRIEEMAEKIHNGAGVIQKVQQIHNGPGVIQSKV